jgi:hypothetical protein
MIQVSVNRLMSAIKEADTFTLPSMNAGTEYLYNAVYKKLATNTDVRLSEIEFSAFDYDDVDTLNNLHSDLFESNCIEARSIAHALRSLDPVCRAVAFV